MKFEARSVGRIRIREDRRIVLDHVQLSGSDFSGRKLLQFAIVGSRLESCRFDRVRIDDAAFGAGPEISSFIDCSFDGARMRLGPGGYTRFERCSFRDVDLRDWFCFEVELIECTFSGRLRKAFFNGTVPSYDDYRKIVGRDRNEFRGNDFSEMELIDVAFRTGVDLSQQCLPSGPKYLYLPDAPSSVRRARSEVIGWQDLELRRRAMALMRTLESELEGGQRQLLLREDDFSTAPHEAVHRVFELLRTMEADSSG
jgi:hypothetical protein